MPYKLTIELSDRDLIKLMTSPAAMPVLKAKGMEPG